MKRGLLVQRAGGRPWVTRPVLAATAGDPAGDRGHRGVDVAAGGAMTLVGTMILLVSSGVRRLKVVVT
jgi:hypothetical protein